MSHKLEE